MVAPNCLLLCKLANVIGTLYLVIKGSLVENAILSGGVLVGGGVSETDCDFDTLIGTSLPEGSEIYSWEFGLH